jgi:predicted NAD/FAD-dependent oxidoreductase
VSLPAPQAAELLGDHPFAAEVAAVPMAPCWAVMVAFERRLDVPWDGAFVHGSPLAWTARDSSKPGRDPARDCWVLHATADWSAARRDDRRDIVAAELLQELSAIADKPAPAPIHLDAHRWLHSAAPRALDRLALCDADSGLAVCGDWLAGGRVEGAFRSGVHAAAQLLAACGVPAADPPWF